MEASQVSDCELLSIIQRSSGTPDYSFLLRQSLEGHSFAMRVTTMKVELQLIRDFHVDPVQNVLFF